jgi:threonine dehydrogenase-like Zn-dependent dehydrogenase
VKAALLHGVSDMRIEEVETPQPGPAEVLLKVAFCGVCGSDFPRIVKDGAYYYPIILGHEFSGVIEDVGAGVSKDLMGKKTACAPLIPNFDDPECAKGNYSLGKGYDFIGSRRQGGFAEYVAIPQRNAVLLDDSVNLLTASFLEPLTVGLHAVNTIHFQPGRAVALTGAGNIGLLLLQSLKHLGGGKIAAFDVDRHQLDLAAMYGADVCLDPRDEKEMSAGIAEMAPRGFEIVFETSGSPVAEVLALNLAAPKGRVVFVGTPHTPLTLQPEEFELINRKELLLQGAWMNYSAPFPGWEWQYGVSLLTHNRVTVGDLVGRTLPLSKADEIPGLLHGPHRITGKLVLDCGE